MRADEAALAALDAGVLVPHRHRVTMFRFSHTEVPDGHVPSIGIPLTGMSSPRPASIGAVTSRTNSGAVAGTAAAFPIGCSPPPEHSLRTAGPECRRPRGSSPARPLALAPYVLRIACLICAIAVRAAGRQRSQRSRSAARCWCARAARHRGDLRCIDHEEPQARLDDMDLHGTRQMLQISSGPNRVLSSTVAPGAARRSTSCRTTNWNW